MEIDTAKVFGVWVEGPNEPHANFILSSEFFYLADYDGNGKMPYILDKNEITIFYSDFIRKGKIMSVANDTLKIKWSDYKEETQYVKF